MLCNFLVVISVWRNLISNFYFFSGVEPSTPTGSLPKTPSIKGRDSIKAESSSSNNAQLLILKKDLEKEQKKTKELQQKLEDKLKNITKLESERDGLEQEKALFETEKKVQYMFI